MPDDRSIAEQDRPTVLREREQPAPMRAYPEQTPAQPLPAAQQAPPPVPAPPAPAPPAQQQKPPSKIFSNLNLNGPVPARARPNIGDWGPTDLPTTKQKKRWRWLAPVLFVVAIIVVTIAGFIFWTMYR